MISIEDEDIVTFVQATDWLPRRRAGKKTALTTLWRWTNVGIKGVLLETIYVGAVRCTSRQALQRFFERVTAARKGGSSQSATGPSGRTRTEAERRKASEKAGAELAAMIANPPKRPTRTRRAAAK
jgi:hypothetical protein